MKSLFKIFCCLDMKVFYRRIKEIVKTITNEDVKFTQTLK